MTRTSRPGKQAGVAIVEFALVLPFLLILIFITTEFGRALYEYGLLTESVRNSARYLTTVTPKTKTTEAKNLAVYGSKAANGTPLVRGLTVANVQDPTWTTHPTDSGIQIVTVEITGYEFKPLVTSAFGLQFGTITFPTISATMRTYL